MAKIYALPDAEDWVWWKDSESADDYFKRQKKLLGELQAKSDALPDSEYVGALIATPRGDGMAIYLVYSLKPLQLCHVPYMDAWRADPVWERGLRVADVKRLVDRDRGVRSIFAGKK